MFADYDAGALAKIRREIDHIRIIAGYERHPPSSSREPSSKSICGPRQSDKFSR
jgi:hypothetical protein